MKSNLPGILMKRRNFIKSASLGTASLIIPKNISDDQSTQELQVVQVAASGEEALEQLEHNEPDVIIMDISLPGMDGIAATHAILTAHPQIQVCILSMHATLEYLHRALAVGVRGYVLKESATAEVVTAVHTVAGGKRFVSRKLIEMLIDDFYLRYNPMNSVGALASLSPRELEIFKLVVTGASSKTIGDQLFLSPKTVDTYRARLMDKLGIHDLPSLIRFGIEHGIAPE